MSSPALMTRTMLPGADVDLGAVTEQAQVLRVAGMQLALRTASIVTSWSALPDSYESTGADGVYAAMDPVGRLGGDVDDRLVLVAGALDAYVDAAKPILARIEALGDAVDAFAAKTAHDYPKAKQASPEVQARFGPGVGGGTYSSWEEDPAAQEENHGLQVRADGLQADLLGAQQRCADAIRRAGGSPAVGDAQVEAAQKALRDTDWHWNASVAADEAQPGCAGRFSTAWDGILWHGAIVDGGWGTVQGLGSLIGWDGETGGDDWSGETAGRSWLGLAHLAVGLLKGPGGNAAAWWADQQPWAPQWMKDWNDADGSAVLGLTGLVGITMPAQWWKPGAWATNDYVARWEQDAPETLGSSIFDVGSLFTGVGTVGKAGAVARLLGRGGTEGLASTTTVGAAIDGGGIGLLRGASEGDLLRLVPGLGNRASAEAGLRSLLLRSAPLDKDALHALDLDELEVRTSVPLDGPVHRGDPEGPGWYRDDEPRPGDPGTTGADFDPRYGHPRLVHGRGYDVPPVHGPRDLRPGDPQPHELEPSNGPTHDLIRDAEAPFGRKADGTPLTRAGYARRFVQFLHGYDRYPGAAAAVPGTRVSFVDVRAFIRIYGDRIDRVGDAGGRWASVVPAHGRFGFEPRGLPVRSLDLALHDYRLTGHLPDDMELQVSEVAPAFGRPGGALQIQFVRVGEHGDAVLRMHQLVEDGVLERVP